MKFNELIKEAKPVIMSLLHEDYDMERSFICPFINESKRGAGDGHTYTYLKVCLHRKSTKSVHMRNAFERCLTCDECFRRAAKDGGGKK